MKRLSANRITAIILLVALQIAFFAPGAAAPAKAQEKHTIVIASSDFQADTDAQSSAQLAGLLEEVKKDYPEADGYLHCGDYTVDTHYEDASQSNSGIKAFLKTVEEADMGIPEENIILGQGNHDPKNTNGLSDFGENDPDGGEYGVFNIKEDGFMWYAGMYSHNGTEVVAQHEPTVKDTAQRLKKYLQAKADEHFTAPIFVISHVPLHFSMRTIVWGDGRYAHYLTDVLNEGAGLGLNIIFLFGHDHSQGWDNYLGGSCIYLPRGSTMKIASPGTNKNCKDVQIGFTYMNAGYTGYFTTEYGENVDRTLTVSVFDITGNSVEIRRYSENGLHDLKSKGVYNLKSFSGKSESSLGHYTPYTEVFGSPQKVYLVTEAQAPVAPTCTEDGILPYYYVGATGKYYSDIGLTEPADLNNKVVKALGHKFVGGVCQRCLLELEWIDEKEPTCTETGIIQCFFDPEGKVYYADMNGQTVLNEIDVVIPLKEHTPDANGRCTVCSKQVFDPPAPSSAPQPTFPATTPVTASSTTISTTPKSTAPRTTAPGSTAPQSAAPASTAPQSTAPQSAAPESAEPQSAAQQSSAPQSTVPASTADDTDPPVSAEASTSAPTTQNAKNGSGTAAIIAISSGAALLIAGTSIVVIKRRKQF